MHIMGYTSNKAILKIAFLLLKNHYFGGLNPEKAVCSFQAYYSALLINIHIDTKSLNLLTPFLLTNVFANICCFDSLCPSQHFFSHVGTGLPGLRG